MHSDCPGGTVFAPFKLCPGGMVLDEIDTCITGQKFNVQIKPSMKDICRW